LKPLNASMCGIGMLFLPEEYLAVNSCFYTCEHTVIIKTTIVTGNEYRTGIYPVKIKFSFYIDVCNLFFKHISDCFLKNSIFPFYNENTILK